MLTGATEVKEEVVVEERIWQAVIVSTIEEWMSGPLRRSREAEQFLFRDESDLHLVCQYRWDERRAIASATCPVAGQTGALRPDSNLPPAQLTAAQIFGI